jgi:tetratricopeptide (TPR) repeat protein
MRIPHRYSRVFFCLAMAACALFLPRQASASELDIPSDAKQAIDLMYQGKTQEAIALAHKLEDARPDHPLGYLIEADILWWNIYCKWSERKYNTIDAWSHTRPADADDDAELALADKVSKLAEAGIAKSDTAEMELYAGLGYASRARLLGLRYEKMPVARAGVEARKHLLRCLELDPNMADAYLGLGLYNYYVDTLSAMAKILRFFMGIPGGDKREGLRQLEIASTKGELTQAEARFNMAKSLRNYDRDYARAEQAAAPLVAEHPGNCIFLLLAGDIEQKLGHKEEASVRFRAAAAADWEEAACAERAHSLAREALASIGTDK